MADLKQFKLPDVGEGLTEADIVKWHVRAGERVEVNQTIIEIETAKAIVELPCPYEGVVAALHVDEGETVDVGVPIISVDVSPDAGAEAPSPEGLLGEDLVPPMPAEGAVEPGAYGSLAPKVDPSVKEQPKRQPVLVGYGVKQGATKRRARKRSSAPAGPDTAAPEAPRGRPAAAVPSTAPVPPAAPAGPAATTGPSAVAAAARAGGISVLAKPPVRKLAKELGVDMSTIVGSGPHGSITREDVHAASASASSPPPVRPAPAVRGEREERIPVRGVLKNMAAAMTRSAFAAPHVTEFLQVDVTETMAAVRRLRELPEFDGVKISPLLFVARALILAARRHPKINSSWHGDEVVVKHYVNLGIAAATDRGLIVPNIKEAQDLSMAGLAEALTRLTETARSGRTPLADMSEGTITITNVGVFGVDAGTPILTPGEVAILAFGQIRDMPWVHEGEIAIRKVTTLALSFDHRVVDGELGSTVLREIGAVLEEPLRMLAWT